MTTKFCSNIMASSRKSRKAVKKGVRKKKKDCHTNQSFVSSGLVLIMIMVKQYWLISSGEVLHDLDSLHEPMMLWCSSS